MKQRENGYTKTGRQKCQIELSIAQLLPMTVANGDQYWRLWQWDAPIAPLVAWLLAPLDLHWRNSLSPLAPFSILSDTFADRT